MHDSQFDFGSAGGAQAFAPVAGEFWLTRVSPLSTSTRPAPEFGDTEAWRELLERVRHAESEALEQLYNLVCRGFGRYLSWRLTEASAADRLHEVMVSLLDAIRRNRVDHPQALIAFIQTIVRRRTAEEIDERVIARRRLAHFDEAQTVRCRRPDPEQEFHAKERQTLLRRMLAGLPRRSREILVRAYLHEQSPEEICRAMRLTPTQYRLLKSRSKARLEENSRAFVERPVYRGVC